MPAARSRSSPIAAPASCASRARPRLRRHARGCAGTSTTRRHGDAPARRSRAVCPGTRRSRACSLRESRLLLAAAARAIRYRRLLRAGAARARAPGRGGRRPPWSHASGCRRRRSLPRRHRPRLARDALRRRPGVVVLHDFVLHHLVAGLTIGRKDGPGYLAAMERDAGVAGRLLAHGVLDGRVPPPWETQPQEFPLAGEVLGSATGLI